MENDRYYDGKFKQKQQEFSLKLNFALNNFANKFGVDINNLDNEYFFLPSGIVINRLDNLDSFKERLKNYSSNFWYLKDDYQKDFEKGLPVFEMVDNLASLSVDVISYLEETYLDDPISSEMVPLTESSKKIINYNVETSSYMLHYEGKLNSIFNHFGAKLNSSFNKMGLVDNFTVQKKDMPKNSDILNVAYATIAYANYFYLNQMKNGITGNDSSDYKGLLSFLRTPTRGLHNLFTNVRNNYETRSFNFEVPRMGGGVTSSF